jgi:NADPH-dependent 2,4-dienoyl-CoA reductase/sulfur reductase-like enzyme
MEYLSLYDYLKKPAGGPLGIEVAAAARTQGIEIKTKEISNPKFTGTIFMYPKDFLDFHFRKPEVEPTLGDKQDYDDDLPF